MANVPTVVIGEVHGTNESQALVAELLYRVAPMRTVLLALELPEASQAAVDRYRASEGKQADVERLLADSFWSGFSDGRNSLSMLRLIEASRVLNAAEADIRVVCMDPSDANDARERDAGMARLVEAAAQGLTDPLTIVLVGNYHSRPIAAHERDAGALNLVSELRRPARVVNLAAARGEMWVCVRDGCGVQPVSKPRPGQGLDQAVLDPIPSPDRHTFETLRLPVFTASFPAKLAYPATAKARK